jgi:exosortase/archaeosortase family protein
MLRKLLDEYNRLRANKNLEPIFDTALFILITLVIHYLYRYWAINLQYHILGVQILTPEIFNWFTDRVFFHSKWVLDILIPIKTNGRIFYFENSYSVQIVESCSGIKQMLQLALLILIYPGPWKHKAWYIPLGILIIHITNVIRISGLGLVMANWPDHWHFAHDYPFRFIFYVVIFFLWVVWNDKFYHHKSKSKVEA